MSAASSIAGDQLRAFIERIERLEEEKAAIAGDIKDIYGEAKGTGFDTKIIRKIVAMRKKDEAERKEEAAILDLYMEALGMLADTPLGQSAIRAAESFRKLAREHGATVSIVSGDQSVRIV